MNISSESKRSLRRGGFRKDKEWGYGDGSAARNIGEIWITYMA